MAELLLELFSEEIPARMQGRAHEDLARLLGDGLKSAGLEFETIRSFATPRRLAVVIDGLPERSADVSEEKKGPRVGAPDAAIQGFLKSAGLKSIDQAETQDDKKGAFYLARIDRPGRATAEIVAELMPKIVRSFPWPKSMRWSSGKLYWVRPLHSILCLLDGKVVAFEIDGIKSGKETRGHRFMAPDAFSVKGFEDYAQKLRDAYVILDSNERAVVILDGARALAAKEGLTLVEDEALLAENAGLTEWPVPLMGKFDESFLEVPAEVLATSMKAHQKCFSLREGSTSPLEGEVGAKRREGGKRKDSQFEPPSLTLPLKGGGNPADPLANRFILVANLEAEDGGEAIIAGNQRVIAARLSDAKFFYEQDRDVGLEVWVPKLKEIIFHDKLGTQYDRVQRVRVLAREISPLVGADPDLAERAAIMAKADLVSGMVGEFPELQGVMGRYYALDQQEDEAVAEAIAAHYKPVGPSDDVPREPIAIAVALADKLDMLTGFWAIDEKPTGSKDPYALRRAALGVIRIVLENSVASLTSPLEGEVGAKRREGGSKKTDTPLPTLPLKGGGGARGGIRVALTSALRSGYNVLWDAVARANEERRRRGAHEEMTSLVPGERCMPELLSFFADRLKVHLRDQGARHDLVDAVFALGDDDLLRIVRRVDALGKFLDTDDGKNLVIGAKRATNILRIEEKKDNAGYDQPPKAKLLKLPEEIALAETLDQVEREAAAAVDKEDFEAAMTAMAKLRAPVDAFFDHVTVNDEDKALRANRLRLLNRIRATTLTVADFSKIEG